MKPYVTDKFLWDLYNVLERMRDGMDFLDPYGHSIINLIAPNTPLAKKYSRQQFSKLISYLKKKSYIKIESLDSRKAILITKEGMKKALITDSVLGKKKKRKDGKWIMVMFDIPEAQRGRRNLLRSILENSGYQQFQKSVWITPYDVLEKTEKVLAVHELDEYVKIFVIEKVV